jgi:hypothetical protein
MKPEHLKTAILKRKDISRILELMGWENADITSFWRTARELGLVGESVVINDNVTVWVKR